MSVTTSEAIAAVRARLNAGTYSFPVYYHGDDPPILPDTPEPFAFVVFNNEGSSPVSFGGGRGESIYRNRARVEVFFFHPDGYGPELVCDLAESIAVRLRSYRNDFISCFASDVVFEGPGSNLSVPGLAGPVNNYAAAIVECTLIYDQTGGGTVDPPGSENTAPVITNNAADFTLVFPEVRVTAGADVILVTAFDAEGGAITWSLPDDDGGNFTITGSGIVRTMVDLLAVSSPYSFTARAADPGGLYAEQIFTVTATAADEVGSDWILASGAWNDAGVWDDASQWKDTA